MSESRPIEWAVGDDVAGKDIKAFGQPTGLLCGMDEAGRGPLAGPVAAAAVILPLDFPLAILGDSKALSRTAREDAYGVISERAIWWVDWAWPGEIDRLNILGATMLAMQRAFSGLGVMPSLVLVDGNRAPVLPCPCRAVVKGDTTEPAIMAASILAKVARDRTMERYDWLYPEYGYAVHKGYPTAAHRAICRTLGPSPIQRMSFSYRKE